MSSKDIRETVGLLLVVASMVFVGLEIRQNNALARAAAYQAIGIASAELWDAQAHDRDFLSATQGKDPTAMDTLDWRQRAAKFTGIARLADMVLTQITLGLLDEDAIDDFGFDGWRGFLDEPTEACIWPLIRPGVSEGLRELVEGGRDPGAIDCSDFAIPDNIL